MSKRSPATSLFLSVVMLVSVTVIGAIVSPVAADTDVGGGNIGTTTWTSAGSPYVVQGDITVPVGATLTIEAGTTVKMSATDAMATGDTQMVEIVVNGALEVVGSAAEPVVFEPQNAGQQWGGVSVAGSASFAYVSMTGGGISSSVDVTVDASDFTDQRSTGADSMSFGGGSSITNSNFSDTVGLHLVGSGVIFEHNVVDGSTDQAALIVEGVGASIVENEFRNNAGAAARFEATGSQLRWNTFMDNGVGVETALAEGELLTATENAFLEASSYDWKVEADATSADYSAEDNYWGVRTSEGIPARIWDGMDDPSLGVVDFEPIVTDFPPEAPLVFHALAVTKSGTGKGLVSETPDTGCAGCAAGTHVHGTIVTLSAEPAAGSVFDGWSGACSGKSSCIVTMSEPRAVNAAFKRRSATKLTIRKSAGRLRISGSVSPKHPGHRVKVILSRKRAGRFRAVAKKAPLLNVNSVFRTAFARPRKGTCRIRAAFTDADHVPSSITKKFRC